MPIHQDSPEVTSAVPLFPPIDQWGALPFPLQPLAPHSLSRVRDILAGNLGAHRYLPVGTGTDSKAEKPFPATVPVAGERAVYNRETWQRAWSRRRGDVQGLAGVSAALTHLDQQIADRRERVDLLLNGQTT